MQTILSVGFDHEKLADLNRVLTSLGHSTSGADTRKKALAAAQTRRFSVILICDGFPLDYAHRLARELRDISPHSLVLLLPKGCAPYDGVRTLLSDGLSQQELAS